MKTAMGTNHGATVLRLARWIFRRCRSEEGGSLVETGLVFAFVYMPILFGIFQISHGIYVYNYVCSVTHQATRYAAMRSSNSCIVQSDFVDCNLSPAGSTNSSSTATTGSGILQNYVLSLKFMGIDPNQITVQALWYKENFTNPNGTGFSTGDWDQPCGSTATCMVGGTANGNSNDIGNAVEVKVTYNYPLYIPFWPGGVIPIKSVSKMMISE